MNFVCFQNVDKTAFVLPIRYRDFCLKNRSSGLNLCVEAEEKRLKRVKFAHLDLNPHFFLQCLVCFTVCASITVINVWKQKVVGKGREVQRLVKK